MTELEIRQIIKDAGVEMLEKRLVQGTWGNISMRLDNKYMLVTPSAMDYIRMTPNDIVKVNIETLEYESSIKPTSEKKIHAAIYRERPEINVVIHSHSVNCSSVAAARREIPVMSAEMQKYIGGSARIGGYGLPGTKKLTVETLNAIQGRNACLMANHGVVVCGSSMEEALNISKIIEDAARLYVEKETMILAKKREFNVSDLFELFRNRKNIKL